MDHTSPSPSSGLGLSESEAAAEARRIIDQAYQFAPPPVPTFYRDDSPVPRYGSTPPVPQVDRRLVPPWATGVAVVSVGVGAGVTGIGCGVWLVLHQLASVTLYGVLVLTLPFAAAAMLVTAIGVAVSGARSAGSETVYEAPVTQHTEIYNNSSTRGMFARTRNNHH